MHSIYIGKEKTAIFFTDALGNNSSKVFKRKDIRVVTCNTVMCFRNSPKHFYYLLEYLKIVIQLL
jgi:hypothetical protein